jgi:hypothetical protein
MIHAASSFPAHLDDDLFNRYLQGDTVDDVMDHLQARASSRQPSPTGASPVTPSAHGFPSLTLGGDGPPTRTAASPFAASFGADTAAVRYPTHTSVGGSSSGHSPSGVSVAGGDLLQQSLDWFLVHQPSIVREELVEQYIRFQELTEQLHLPYTFLSATGVPMSLAQRKHVVNLYYKLDTRLAVLWYGDRSTRIDDVEDGELQEEGLGTVKEVCIRRQLANLKRVSKFITSGYRGRDNMLIPPDVPLQSAIERIFCLSPYLASQYATFVFGFEHRLESKSIEKLEYDEVSNLSHAVGALWCDASRLLLREEFCDDCCGIAAALSDTKVQHELYHQLFGELPKLRWQVLDDVHKAITTSASSNAASAGQQQPPASSSVSPSPSVADVSTLSHPHSPLGRQPSMMSIFGPGGSGGGAGGSGHAPPLAAAAAATAGGGGGGQGPPSSMAACVSLPASMSGSMRGGPPSEGSLPGGAAAGGAAAPAGWGSQGGQGQGAATATGFSRRFMAEHVPLVKLLSKLAHALYNNRSIREVLDLFYFKMLSKLEREDNVTAAAAAAAAAISACQSTSSHSGSISSVGASSSAAAGVAGGGLASPVSSAVGGGGSGNLSVSGAVLFAPSPASHAAGDPMSAAGSADATQLLNTSLLMARPGGASVANSKQLQRELSAWMGLIVPAFAALSSISAADHRDLDEPFRELVAVLRVLLQITLAHEET